MNSYKYFFIYDRNNNIIYGECIVWKCGEFDLTEETDLTIGLKQRFKARFIAASQKINFIHQQRKKIEIIEGISFNYEKEYNDSLTLRSDETIYNPLIDRCSKISMFTGHQIIGDEYQNWIIEHKNLLKDIKKRFDLDFSSRPELINSFTFYNPARIVVKPKFIDKPASGEDREPTKLNVTFYDEFNTYTQADYIITGYFEETESQTVEGKILDGKLTVDFHASPYELEIKIIDQGIVVYNSKHGFIRSVKIRSKVLGDTVALENGSIISKYSELNMTVGKE